MKYLKKFELFESDTKTADPTIKPADPKVRPSRPSPIRRDKPSVTPAPKALKKSSAEEVADKFIQLSHKSGDLVKNYYEDEEL